MEELEFFPLGDQSVIIDFSAGKLSEIPGKIKKSIELLKKDEPTWLIEFVPGFNTLTVHYSIMQAVKRIEGGNSPFEKVCIELKRIFNGEVDEISTKIDLIEIPVCYGGNQGPDLQEVSRLTNLSPREVIDAHTKPLYTVRFIGFAPGFPYLSGLDEALHVPRKQNPRKSIPVGSVGLGGKQTGVYSLETPGGWQLIGRTPLTLFSPSMNPPSLLKSGDSVRFVPITELEYETLKKDLAATQGRKGR